MDPIHDIRTLYSVTAGIISMLCGWFGWLAIIYACAIFLDWIAGTLVAKNNGEWSSKAARIGCWHKMGSIISVFTALMLDGVIGIMVNNIPSIQLPYSYPVLFGPIVLIWYITIELGSIIENVGHLGAPVPTFLVKAIKALNSSVQPVKSKKR